ncbi:MAG: phytanoyl-CoA dioxygenase family protein [Delftia acidovorans]|nr:phytanoyl-CoA dioxygenase family protein [Delftia acidovorans]
MQGHVEFVTAHAVIGWLFDPVARRSPRVCLSVNGVAVREFIPDIVRDDLIAVSGTDGAHGFHVALEPGWLRAGANHVRIADAATGETVPNGEHWLDVPGHAALAEQSDRANPLPGVPSIESPFFDRLFADADPALREIAENLRRDGYCVIDFPDPEIAAVAASIRATLEPHFDWADWRGRGHAAGEGMRIQDAWRDVPGVRRIAANPALIDLLTRLYGRRARPFQTLNFPVGTQQHFHSDCVHFSSVPERFMCGVWVALEDIGAAQGPLVYYPGTHRWPIYTNEHLGLCATESESRLTQAPFEPVWRELVAAAGIAPRVFHARRGQALIWAANLLHGGMPQARADLTRWSQVTHYYFDDCAYVTPMHSDPAYGRTWFRHPVDISTGEVMQNRYAGLPVPQEFIERVHPRARTLPADFDAEAYLAANPDVRGSSLSPADHWLGYGRFEGRRLRP